MKFFVYFWGNTFFVLLYRYVFVEIYVLFCFGEIYFSYYYGDMFIQNNLLNRLTLNIKKKIKKNNKNF